MLSSFLEFLAKLLVLVLKLLSMSLLALPNSGKYQKKQKQQKGKELGQRESKRKATAILLSI